jgi:peptidoglycan/xylan/chitin deacetylase (PgdA/CDA1 family)
MVLSEGTNFEDFDNYDDWNNYNTRSTVAASEYEGVKVTNSEITASFGMKRYRTNIASSLTYVETIGYKFYIEDISKVAKIAFYWFNNTSGNARRILLYSPYDGDGSRRELEQGWNFIQVPVRNWVKVGDGMDWSRVDVVQHEILVYPTTNSTATVHFSECVFNHKSQNYAMLSFDDGLKSLYSNLHDWLVSENIPANLYISKQFADTGNPTYCTEAELQAMYDTGIYEFCNHSYANPANLYQQTDAVITADYTQNRDWIISKGWNRKYSAYTYATPGAGYIWRPATLDVLINAGCKFIRTNRNYHSNFTPFIGYGMHCVFSSSIGAGTNISSYLGEAYNFYRCGNTLIPYAHGAGDGGGLDTPVTNLKQIITGLKGIGYKFVKFGDWYEMYTQNKRIPVSRS